MSENINTGTQNSFNQLTILYTASSNDENTTKLLNTQDFKELIVLKQNNTFEDYLKVKNKVDIIITDISAKDSFSFSFIKQLRGTNDWETPVLIISDLNDPTILSDIIKLKIENFIWAIRNVTC